MERNYSTLHGPEEEINTLSDALTHCEIDIISKGTSTDLRTLGRELGLTESEISTVEFDNNAFGIYEQCYRMVVKWQQKKGRTATKEEMVKALIRAGKREIIEQLEFNDKGFLESCLQHISTINIEETNDPLTRLLIRVREEQKLLYSNNDLPQPVWSDLDLPLEVLYVDLEMFEVNRKGEEEAGKVIKLKHLFDQNNDQDVFRILIEGGPGYGKTTLGLKLVSDWSNGKEYIAKKFSLIFMITLRALTENETYLDIIKEEIGNVSEEKIMSFLSKFQKQILLILDGFDEINDDMKFALIPLLQRREFPEMSVILTSRLGHFSFQETRKAMSGLMQSKRMNVNNFTFWQRRIKIKGIAPQNQQLFLLKTFETECCEEEIQNVLSKISVELLECPLFLILIAILIAEEKSISITTKTSLYKILLNFVVRRSLVRERLLPTDVTVDIFEELTNNLNDILQTLYQFGKLCLHHLIQSKFSFSEEEITNFCGKYSPIFKFGLLFKHVSFPRRNRVEYYEPLHRSFMEFLAAYYLWSLSLNSNNNLFDQEIVTLISNGISPSRNSLLYPFLGGLLNERSHQLFTALSRWKVFDISQKSALSYVITEIEDSEQLSSSIESFIPPLFSIEETQQIDVNREYMNSSKRQQIFRAGIAKGRISYIRWESCVPFNIEDSFYVNTLEFHFNLKIDKTLEKIKDKSVKCHNLICYFGEGIDENSWRLIVDIICSISTKTIKFDYSKRILMPFKIFPLMQNELQNGRWRHLVINRFTIDNLRNDFGYEIVNTLIDLIKSNRITDEIKIRCFSYVSFTASDEVETNMLQMLLDAISNSQILKTFLFSYYGQSNKSVIDFSSICLGQKKTWNRLKFNGEFEIQIESSSITERCFADELLLDIRNVNLEMEVLSYCQEVKYLFCRNGTFFQLSREKYLNHLENLQELTLLFHDKTVKAMPSDNIKCLKQLRVLSLDSLRENSLPSSAIPFVLEIIKNTELKNLEIVFSSWSPTINEFLNCIVELENQSTNDKNLQNLVLAMEGHQHVNEIRQCFSIVERLLKAVKITRFCLLNPSEQQLQQLLSFFTTEKMFKIFKEPVVTNETYSKYLQYSFFHNKVHSHSVCVTL